MNTENIKAGTIVNVFGISDFMATTTRNTLIVKEVQEDKFIITMKGKRKKFKWHPGRSNGKDNLVFITNEIPFKTDVENAMVSGKSFTGNAMINLIGKISNEEAKNFIEKNNLNENLHKKYIQYNGIELFPENNEV